MNPMGIGFGAVVAHFMRCESIVILMFSVLFALLSSLIHGRGAVGVYNTGNRKTNGINHEVITNSPTVKFLFGGL